MASSCTLTIFLVLFLLVGLTKLQETEDPPLEANDIVDQILLQLASMPDSKVDPFSMVDIQLQMMGMTVTMYNGEVRGLSSMKRTGNCLLYLRPEWLRVVIDAGSNQMTAKVNVKFGRIDLGTGTTIRLKTEWSRIDMSIYINVTSKVASLEYIRVKELEGIQVWVEGNAVSKYLIGPLSDSFSRMFIDSLHSYVEEVLAANMRAILTTAKLPL